MIAQLQQHTEIPPSQPNETSPTSEQIAGGIIAIALLATLLIVGLANAGVFKKQVPTDYWGRPLQQ